MEAYERELHALSCILKAVSVADTKELDLDDIVTVLKYVSDHTEEIYVDMLHKYSNEVL
jgi:hypothetical protein